MKKLFNIINIVAVLILAVSGMFLGTDAAIRVWAISAAYLALYAFRREIAKAVYKAIEYSFDVLKESWPKR